MKIDLRVAAAEDLELLIATPSVFKDMNQAREMMTEFTDVDRDIAYPYVCIALSSEKIIGKLYLDRNGQNAIRRNLDAATIDSVIVDASQRAKGVGDSLIECAEELAARNGVRWIEIGVVVDNPKPLHSYIRRGYFKNPVWLESEFRIFYEVRNETLARLAPRYGKAVVVYKDLHAARVLSKSEVNSTFESLTSRLSR